MTSIHHRALIDIIQHCAARHETVLFAYRKSLEAARAREAPREVEPYSMSEGQQDILIRCFQLAPEEGWRSFMVHKIEDAKPSGRAFKPRRKVTIHTGEIKPNDSGLEHWTDQRKAYRDACCDAMADATLTPAEIKALRAERRRLQLTADDVMFVHAGLYARQLNAMIDDGTIDEAERQYMIFLDKVFTALGWKPGQPSAMADELVK